MQEPTPTPAPAELVAAPAAVELSSASAAVELSSAPAPAAVSAADPVSATKKQAGGSKRYRPCGPPFYEIVYGQNNCKLRVKLDVPDPGEECPLTLSPMAEDAIECLSDAARWFPAFPDVKRATLPCGHAFGALNILYHFARRNMLCPCCRAGLNTRVDIMCIPAGFRALLSSKVQSELREDAEEQVRQDREAAEDIVSGVLSMFADVVEFAQTDGVRLKIQFHGESPGSTVTIDVPLVAGTSRTAGRGVGIVFRLERGPYMSLIEMQLGDETVTGITLSTCLSVRNRSIEMASTGLIAYDRRSNRTCISEPSLTEQSFFDLEVVNDRAGGSPRVAWLAWRTPMAVRWDGD